MEGYMLYIEPEATQRAMGGVALGQALPQRIVPARTAEEGLVHYLQAPLACKGAIARHHLPGLKGTEFFARVWQHDPGRYGEMFNLLFSSLPNAQVERAASQLGVEYWSPDSLGSSSLALARHAKDRYATTRAVRAVALPARSLASPRLLYVDDDGMDRLRYGTNLKMRLGDIGYEVVCMDSPRKGLVELTKNPQQYQVVVSDYHMPGHTGLEFLQDIGSIPDLDHLLRILVSNAPPPGLAEQAKSIGAVLVPKEKRARVFADAIYELVSASLPPAPKRASFSWESALP